MRPPILQRIAAEPAALGTLVASVLPAFVALGILTMDAETIGVLVVAVNALTGFAIRMLVAPLPRGTAPAPAR
jgi:hypothetical protein